MCFRLHTGDAFIAQGVALGWRVMPLWGGEIYQTKGLTNVSPGQRPGVLIIPKCARRHRHQRPRLRSRWKASLLVLLR